MLPVAADTYYYREVAMQHTIEQDDRAELGFIIRSRGESHVRAVLTEVYDALLRGDSVTVTTTPAPKPVVRFVEDGQIYSPGDFGDEGNDVQAQIDSGDLIVLGMLTYDETKITDLTTDTDLVCGDALIDSLWCIVVSPDAINDTGHDIEWSNLAAVKHEYLRGLATEALTTAKQ